VALVEEYPQQTVQVSSGGVGEALDLVV